MSGAHRTPRSPPPGTGRALVAGGFYLITFISSVPAVFLLDPVLNDPNYILSRETGWTWISPSTPD